VSVKASFILCNSLRCLVAAALLIVPPTTVAQDDLSQSYDVSRVVTLSGSVSKLEWAKPHVLVKMIVKRERGLAETWTLEAGEPREFGRGGLDQGPLGNRNSPAGDGISRSR
jgi:hypothetical protein